MKDSRYSDLPLFRSQQVEEVEVAVHLPPVEPMTTLQGAQDEFLAEIRSGVDCQLCGRFAKLYKRPLHAAMARDLIIFVNWSRRKPGWFHALTVLTASKIQGSDYSKLVMWGLLAKKSRVADDGNPSTGHFAVTDNGIAFVQERLQVPRDVYTYDKELLAVGVDLVGIREVLGKKFDYNKLMRA